MSGPSAPGQKELILRFFKACPGCSSIPGAAPLRAGGTQSLPRATSWGLSTWEEDEEELGMLDELWKELCAVRLLLSSNDGKNLLGNDVPVDGLGVVRLSWMDRA